MPPPQGPPPLGTYPPPWASVALPRVPKWPALAALVLSLLAAGLAVAAWFRPSPESRPPTPPKLTYSAQQVTQAKAHVCDAYQKEQKALDLAGARNGGDDPTAVLAVATAIRQVLDVGSRNLLAKLAEEPATPSDLANAVHVLARLDLELTIGYLDGLSNSDPELQPTLKAGDEAALNVQRLCKS